MSVKAIFLDFYGTVVHEDEKVITNICEQIKANSQTDATVSEIGGVWWKELSTLFNESHGENFIPQRTLEETSIKRTLSYFQSNLDETKLVNLMFRHWMTPAIFQDAVEFLKQNTLPVYILSNIDRSDILEAIHLHQLLFKDIITSEDVKSYKPGSEMFEHALMISGLNPNEVIHVGDSLSSDIAGANNIGIKNVWVNRNNRELKGIIKPDYEINNLKELLNIVKLRVSK
ncbi:HAD family hydrolase [Aquibacillus koreensis]|uniref:HAD family hydrolase n=1 Tax=Aquibacillus koreensis TaxID=279446 RepID=A0A9X3WLI6_9BACI|nr:HAD family hydrolase [Aquibacillus koreensis]MCT2536886.1 HAD family hydrolase [Aquibacillus koreensis]MDC3421982.1 HAD family hydrolase [Aquibacillus koreensis]